MVRRVPVQRWTSHGHTADTDPVAEEDPLEILIESSFKDRRVTRSWGITLRTPGHDDDLVRGLLFSEGTIHSNADVASIEALSDGRILVRLAPEVDDQPAKTRTATAACGLCGVGGLPDLEPLPDSGFRMTYHAMHTLQERIREHQEIFRETGGVHAAALFNSQGEILAAREDIGRHNAVDKLIGWALPQGLVPLQQNGLLLSGRAGFELIHKAARAGIPFVAAIGAPTTLSVTTANRLNITLAAFLRPEKTTLYSGSWRLQKLPAR